MSTKITKPYPIYINEAKCITRLSSSPVGINGYVGDGNFLFGSPQGSLDQAYFEQLGLSMMRLPGGSNSDVFIWNGTGYSNAPSGVYNQGQPTGTDCAFPPGRPNQTSYGVSAIYLGTVSGITTPKANTDYQLIASTLKAANPNATFNMTANYGSGPGISETTTTTGAITATGAQTVAITAVTDGSLGPTTTADNHHFAVTIDTGTNAELVEVTGITGSQFNVTGITGNFTKTHVSGATVQWYAPQSGQPSLAASWITDANSTNNFAAKYWCIGNEVYGGWEPNFWPSVAQSTTAVTAGASVAVTFANGQSVNDGSLFVGQKVLVVDYVNGNETVSVTASTATSLTATFVNAHSGTYQLQWGYPSMTHSQTVRDGQQYGQAVKTYISDMKNSDPAIKVGVCIDNGQMSGDGTWASPSGAHGMGVYNPANDPFNNGLFGELTATTPTFTGIGPSANVTLGGAAVQPDFVEFHWYPFGGDGTNRTVNESSIFAITAAIPDLIANIQALLKYYYPNTWQSIEILVGETAISAPTPDINQLTGIGAIFLARSYATWLSNGISSIMNWAYRGFGQAVRNDTNWDMYGIHPTIAHPPFGDYSMLTNDSKYNSGGTGTTSTTNAPGTAGSGQNIPFPSFYALQCAGMVFTAGSTVVQCTSPSVDLETYATKQTDGSIGVLIINKSKTASYTVSPSVVNAENVFGTAKVVSVSAEDQTDFTQTPPVGITPTITPLPVENNTASFTVKPYSVSAIQLTVGSRQLIIGGTQYPATKKAMPTVLIASNFPEVTGRYTTLANNGFSGAFIALNWGTALTNITAVPTVGGSYNSSYYSWNESYFQQVKNEIQAIKEAGLTVHIDLGMQYPPDSGTQVLSSLLYGQSANVRMMSNNGVYWWAGGYTDNSPGVYGNNFGGFMGSGLECANTVFDPISRIAGRDYLQKVLYELGPDNIDSIRWGAGMRTGEVQYPQGDNAYISPPSDPPVLNASGSGTALAAGTYEVAYSWANSFGETTISPTASIAITAGQSISVESTFGSVTSTTITAGGTGYTSAPTVTFSAPASGTTATGNVVLSGTAVSGINMTNNGSGYTSNPTITFSGGGGSGATATSSVAAIPYNSPYVNWYASTVAGGTTLGKTQQATTDTATISVVGSSTAPSTTNNTGVPVSLWCYDALAQNTTNGNSFTDPSLQPYTNIPSALRGLKPDTSSITPANAYSLLQWYVQSLVNTVIWGINVMYDAGFTGEVEVLVPGWGSRVSQTNNIWNYGRSGEEMYDVSYPSSGYPINNPTVDLQYGIYADMLIPQVAALGKNTSIHCTWSDASANPPGTATNPSPFHYQAQLARRYGLPMVAENTGPPLIAQNIDATTASTNGGTAGLNAIGMYYNVTRYAQGNCRRVYIAFENGVSDFGGPSGNVSSAYIGQAAREFTF